MRPELTAGLFFAVWLVNAAIRGSLTEPGAWIGAVMALLVTYVVFAFLHGKSGEDGQGGPVTRMERLHGFAANYPWRNGFAFAAAIFAVWMALWPLFDRSPLPLAIATSALVFVWVVAAGFLHRKQQRNPIG